jgi:hypothetical protein
MKSQKAGSPFSVGLQTMRLATEAQQVIGLRLIKLARGGSAAHQETARMLTEKIAAATTSWST